MNVSKSLQKGLLRDGIPEFIDETFQEGAPVIDPRWTFFSVDLEITNVCDHFCAMCPRAALTRPQGFMEEKTFSVIAEKLAAHGSRVALSGMGNPLVHPKWGDFVRLYKKNGGRIGMVVHAADMHSVKVDELLEARPDFLEVSFPTFNEELFAKLFPDAVFSECLDRLLHLAAKGKGRVSVIPVGLQTGLNRDEGDSFFGFWREHGLTARFFPCHRRGGALRPDDLVVAERHPPFDESLRGQWAGATCGLFAIHSFITWQGMLLSCCHDVTGSSQIGDLVKESVADLSQKKARKLEKGNIGSLCKQCDEFRASFPLPTGPYPETPRARTRQLKKLGKIDLRVCRL